MPRPIIYLWKKAPFLRLLLPFMAGIGLEWYVRWTAFSAWLLLSVVILFLLLFNLRAAFMQFRAGWFNGLLINIGFIALGWLMVFYKDVSNSDNWLNQQYQAGSLVTAILEEPVSEKENSYKAMARIETLDYSDSVRFVKGNILIYFKKDSAAARLDYGSVVVFDKSLQPIRSAGNPGAFDYARYAALQGIYQQVYLQPGDYRLLPAVRGNRLTRFLFTTRASILSVLTRYIPGEREAGLAEALLVGYKDDLDKTLVQSYSNTGVVHIIAISGMHLGLIYWILTLILTPLRARSSTRWMVPVLTVTGLWIFSLIAGGGPSILRSAVMFSCIAIGESIQRKTYIYNSLAASAFILLCIDPFWLGDAGFQLSYAAVLSIVIFRKPVYNWLTFQNKIVETVWQLCAVTIAAQILTTAVSIYHFHQFPVYFLLTNLLAVPLSSLVVLLEILLCAIAPLHVLAHLLGTMLYWLIYGMNRFVQYMEHLPGSTWGQLQLSIFQLLVAYGFIAAMAHWLSKKSRLALYLALLFALCFFGARSVDIITKKQVEQIIVYNVPKHAAIDFVSNGHYLFMGDSTISASEVLQRYHLLPARLLYRLQPAASLPNLTIDNSIYLFNQKTVLVLSHGLGRRVTNAEKMAADVIVLSNNAQVTMDQLQQSFAFHTVVVDGSNNYRNVHKWKEDAAKLGLYCFSTVDKGAFVMSMD